MEEKIAVAVIGAGEIATKAHIPAYRVHKDVDLVALVDIDKKKGKRAAKRFGVKRFFSTVDDLFQEMEVDAVSVCTPPQTHAEVTLKAFAHNAHVLCEKPLAINVDDGKRMLEASRARGKILMVGFNRRFQPNYQKARKFILDGALGNVYLIEDHLLQQSPLFAWGKSQWFYTHGIGGVVLDLGPHVVDMLNYLFGDFPAAVTTRATTHLDSPVEEFCTLVLEYPKNKTGVAFISWLASKNIENVAIHGTAQSLYVSPRFFLEVNATDLPEVSLWRVTTERLIGMKFPNLSLLGPHVRGETNTYRLEIDHFVRHVRTNKTTCSNAEDALNVLAACIAMKESLETNRRTEIPSFKPVQQRP